eukprot:5609095-Alexandrium_andersonii.AAC.1
MDRRTGGRPAPGSLAPAGPPGRHLGADRPDCCDAVEDAADGPGGVPVRRRAMDLRARDLQPG